MTKFDWKTYDWSNDVGPGWKSIVDPLQEYAKEHDFLIKQVKEKFGGLRFYSLADSTLDKMVRDAEKESYKTCEICGEPGSTEGSKGWITVRCDYHRNWSQEEERVFWKNLQRLD
jgi:hypothetical protein